mgnify:CR=1 FL=1
MKADPADRTIITPNLNRSLLINRVTVQGTSHRKLLRRAMQSAMAAAIGEPFQPLSPRSQQIFIAELLATGRISVVQAAGFVPELDTFVQRLQDGKR